MRFVEEIDEGFGDCLDSELKEAIELGHARAAQGLRLLHGVGEQDELIRFQYESLPRQIGDQPAQEEPAEEEPEAAEREPEAVEA